MPSKMKKKIIPKKMKLMKRMKVEEKNFCAIDASLTLHPAKARELVSEKDESRKATEDKDENELKGMKKKLAIRRMGRP